MNWIASFGACISVTGGLSVTFPGVVTVPDAVVTAASPIVSVDDPENS